MSRKNIFFAIGTFTLLTFLQPAINFFLLPVYLEYFPAEEYGIYGLANSIAVFVGLIIAFRISSAVYTYYFNFKYNEKRVKDFIGSVYSFTLLTGVTLFGLSLIIGPSVFKFIFKSDAISFYPYGVLAISIALCNALNAPYFVLIKNQKKVKKYAILYISLVVISIIGQVLLIIVYKLGAAGALTAKLIANGALCLVILALVIKEYGLSFKSYYIKRSLLYSIPLLPYLLINWTYDYGDRYVLEQFLSLKVVGIYSLLVTLTGLISMALDAAMNGIQPYLFEAFGQPESKEKNKNINFYYKIYLSIAVLAASGIILLGTNIHLLTKNPDYLQIIPYVFAGAIVVSLRGYVNVFRLNLMYAKYSSLISIVSVFFVAGLITFYFVLIPRLELWGAIFSNLMASISWALIFGYFSQKRFPVSLNTRTFIIEPFFVLSMIGVAYILAFKGIISFSVFGWLQIFITVMLLLFINRSLISRLRQKKLKS